MGTVRSDRDAKEYYVSGMGEPLGTLFGALWQEVATLHHEWADYVALFGTKPSRIELLNKAAPSFFYALDGVWWEHTILHIARLTDSPKSAGRQNLTIQCLAPLIDDSSVQQRVSHLVASAVETAAFCRDWRNRRIAHRDLEHALDGSAKPLAEGNRLKVKAALSAIVEVLNAVSLHYTDSTSAFDLPGEPGGAESLLHVIDSGVRKEAERRESLLRGEIPPDEPLHRDI